MYSLIKIIKAISLIGAFVLALTTARAVDPPPDGGYPNFNTAEGDDALFSLTTGSNNTAIGFDALLSNTIGVSNTATGYQALFSNTSGVWNTANGVQALLLNSTGFSNTATGFDALNQNTTGSENTGTGYEALFSNNGGGSNTGTGYEALFLNKDGQFNTAYGAFALFSNTSGTQNIAVGYAAGLNLTTGNHNIDIGNRGRAGDNRTIRIGSMRTQSETYIAAISGVTVPGGVGVIVGTNGKLGTTTSSVRFKKEIKPMGKASEAILAFKPATFRDKQDLDSDDIPQFGLVAEDVAKVNPDLVARDEEGNPYTVRYEAVNAMLLNEFLKEHRKVGEQAATITDLKSAVAQQQKDIAALTAALKAQAAQIQKVSDQLVAQAPSPRVVAND